MDSVLLSLSIKVFKFESKMGIGALITFQDVVHIIHWKINVFNFVVYISVKHYCHDEMFIWVSGLVFWANIVMCHLHTVGMTDLGLLGKIPINPKIYFKHLEGSKLRYSQSKQLIIVTTADTKYFVDFVTAEMQVACNFQTLTSPEINLPNPYYSIQSIIKRRTWPNDIFTGSEVFFTHGTAKCAQWHHLCMDVSYASLGDFCWKCVLLSWTLHHLR